MSDAVAGWYDESERDRVTMLQLCMQGRVEEVRSLIQRKLVNVNETDEDGVTALQIASAKGQRNLVEYLLKVGAEINSENNVGMTPFLHACREGHVDIVIFLANNQADIQRTTGLGVDALTLACAGRHLEVIRVLKIFNLSMNPSPIKIAPSPFMAACYNNDIGICGFLAQHGCNVNIKLESLNLDAKTFTIKCGFHYILNFIEDFRDDQPPKKSFGTTIQSGNVAEVMSLLASPNMAEPPTEGVTPLMYAVVMGKLKIAAMIIERNLISIDAQESVFGMTALMFSIITGDNDMVQLLLKSGAKVGIRSTTKVPFTAIDLSQYANGLNNETLLLLYRHYLKIVNPLLEVAKPSTFDELHYIKKTSANALHRVLNKIKHTENPLESMVHENPSFFISNVSHDDWSESPPFLLAEDILRGYSKPRRIPTSDPNFYVISARNLAMRWMSHGDVLNPFPIGIWRDNVSEDCLKTSKTNTIKGQKSFDNFLSIAQRNAYGSLKIDPKPPTTEVSSRKISVEKQSLPFSFALRNAPNRPNSDQNFSKGPRLITQHDRAQSCSKSLNAESTETNRSLTSLNGTPILPSNRINNIYGSPDLSERYKPNSADCSRARYLKKDSGSPRSIRGIRQSPKC
ncbi:ankyrin repeats (3 copies) domain-containing protein [Ditylenchus destructor]|nr:ankyrin repeats (3 copies) domain-containing protein [Ditylenchus destructor]